MTNRKCEQCGGDLVRRPQENLRQWTKRRFCSRRCFGRYWAQRAPSPENPGVYANYREDPATGCWVWQGYADRNGYGRLFDASRPKGRRIVWAHRAFYERFKGPIPTKHEIDHICCNTMCVFPGHLDAVTKVEHARRTFERLGVHDRQRLAAEFRTVGLTYAEIADALGFAGRESAAGAVKAAISKGLVNAGDLPEVIRLTETEREDVRVLYAAGIAQTEIAAWYGVDSSHISRICNGRSNGHESARKQAAA